ncbi:hypothetical protein GCM10010112_62650 [Actinoplanes lobatus]|uniref:Rad50/SbcC-type AAA domain-containing protein n=1 Tax=Actinoplanes lobatus TaxID=113568 RepID=A0A7W7MJA7_9ACTN|nr:ATP-binding protein [Actinoplanes lobatus]MBB4752191.1 hypothetical protein [Actinoplanes lobatus]GGN83875.1 hypothetical protein GCM10010112_62650 [Actinoplanes lobatus]GIE45452.1 hypothetical protein Alo02nite_83500 [Actinoplanes lobatus]
MSPEELATRIARRAGVPVPVVERVFDENDFSLILSGALPRPVQLHRLRIVGNRSVDPVGPFDRVLRFGAGLTVLAADNLRGKTSVLELITWCLRGSPRANLQGVVRGWLSRLDCDVTVAGRLLGFRLLLQHGRLVQGRIISAPDQDSLARADKAGDGPAVVELAHTTDPDAFAAMVAKLMMELLNLERLEASSTRNSSGRTTFGWPAYFGALYLPPGGDPALLGDVVTGGLPGRLLQVFLDLPGAALLTRLKTARDQLEEADRAADADSARMRALLSEQRADAERRLAAARDELTALGETVGAASLLTEISDLTTTAVSAESSLREARENYELLRWQRLSDARHLADLREHESARLFFHALDPEVCPRCEGPISPARRAAERAAAICAVCTEPAGRPAADPAETEAAEQEAQWRLAASQEAEKLARTHRDKLAAYAEECRRALATAEQALTATRAGQTEQDRRALIDRVARLEGTVSAWDSLPMPGERPHDDNRTVLAAATAELTELQTAASDTLFEELNADIAGLARDFGFRNLDRIVADRAGRLQVFKTGGPREWFTRQSPGERLRLRIAVVVALLRIGHRHGVATHPGLLLIDSPRSEEVQDDNAAALLVALEQLCTATPGLQILVTTADQELVGRTLQASTIISPPGPGQPLW